MVLADFPSPPELPPRRSFMNRHEDAFRRALLGLVAVAAVYLAAQLWFTHLGAFAWDGVRWMVRDEHTFTIASFAILVVLFAARAARRRCRYPASAVGMPMGALADSAAVLEERAKHDADLSETARHEAIHAVAAARAGMIVTELSTRRQGNTGGHCSYNSATYRGPVQDELFERVVFDLAPHIDEIRRDRRTFGPSTDLENAVKHCYGILAVGAKPSQIDAAQDELTVESLLAHAREAAGAILDEQEDAIRMLASHLDHPGGVHLSGPALRNALAASNLTAAPDSNPATDS